MVGESYCPSLPTHIDPRSVLPRTSPSAGLGTRGVGSVRGAHVHTTTSTAGHLNRPGYVNVTVNRFPPIGTKVEALYSQPPPFPNLPGSVITLVLTTRPNQCVPGQVQESGTATVSVIVLTPSRNRELFSKHPHICCFWSPAPALVVPCSPMPVVTSVNQVAAYQACSHQATACHVDHVLHAICPNVMTLGSQRRAVASWSRGE